MDPTGATRDPRELVLEAGDARVVVRPEEGGRVGSLVVAGREVLWPSDPQGLIHWGSYPMAPWAGRVRRGRFTFAGRPYELPLGMPPHAIHGVVYDRPWEVLGRDAIGIELDERWPFRGRAEQRFALDEDGLSMTLVVEADEPMPATVGWHPWFRRSIGEGIPEVRLRFEAGTMLVRDDEGMPSGERVPPTPGPWDDAFTDVAEPPVLEWGETPAARGQLDMRLVGRLHGARPWALRRATERAAGCAQRRGGHRRTGVAADPRDALAVDAGLAT